MNEEDFLTIEDTTRRIVLALRPFACPLACAQLAQLQDLVAELRLASQTLCQPSTSIEQRQAATNRLTDLFLPF